MRRGGAALGGSRPARLPDRGGPRLRPALVRRLARRSARPALVHVHARLGHGRRGRAVARRAGDRRLLDPQRLHGGDRHARGLRRVGDRAGATRPWRPTSRRARETLRVRPANTDEPAPLHVAFLEAAGELGFPLLDDPDDPSQPVGGASLPSNVVEGDPLEHGVRVPRRGAEQAEPRRPRRHAGRPAGPGRRARDGRASPPPASGSTPTWSSWRRARTSRRRSCCGAGSGPSRAGAARDPGRRGAARGRGAARPPRHRDPMGADRAPLDESTAEHVRRTGPLFEPHALVKAASAAAAPGAGTSTSSPG